MIIRWIPLVVAVAIVSAGVTGCRSHICNRCPTTVQAPPIVVPRAQYYQPAPVPCPGCERTPSAVTVPPPVVGQAPNFPALPGTPPPGVAERPPTGTWKPAQPSPQEPKTPSPSDDSNRAKLNLPEPMDRPPPVEGKDAPRTPKKDELAVEIPQFDVVYDRVAAGLQPFPDGFSLLASHGYRSVLHVRRDSEDGTALRTNIEAKGLKYHDLVVSPSTLNRDIVDRFSRLITDSNLQPIFVFDRKGQLAGALWYLHFRLNDGLPEVEARKRAVRLGLEEDATGENAELWLAINRILRGA